MQLGFFEQDILTTDKMGLDKETKETINDEVRRKVNNYLTELGFNVGTFTITIDYMKQEIGEVKTLLKDFIEKSEKKFATKEDHIRNEKRIDMIMNVGFWIIGIIGTAIIGAILKLVIIG